MSPKIDDIYHYPGYNNNMSKRPIKPYISDFRYKKLMQLVEETGLSQSQLIDEAIEMYWTHYTSQIKDLASENSTQATSGTPVKKTA